MPIDNAKLAPMQPGVSVGELKAALGTSWRDREFVGTGARSSAPWRAYCVVLVRKVLPMPLRRSYAIGVALGDASLPALLIRDL